MIDRTGEAGERGYLFRIDPLVRKRRGRALARPSGDLLLKVPEYDMLMQFASWIQGCQDMHLDTFAEEVLAAR